MRQLQSPPSAILTDSRDGTTIGPFMSWQSLTEEQLRILACAKDGRPPWDCVPNVIAVIGELNQLIAFGLLDEDPPIYRLTELGAQALEHRSLRPE